jgi:hypothetical protein
MGKGRFSAAVVGWAEPEHKIMNAIEEIDVMEIADARVTETLLSEVKRKFSMMGNSLYHRLKLPLLLRFRNSHEPDFPKVGEGAPIRA